MTCQVEKRLMAPGSFTIDLTPDAPEWLVDMTSRHLAAVLVLPGKVTNPAKVPITQLYADAWYVGIHNARPDRRRGFGGFGPSWLLKLARQPSDQTVSKRPLYDGTSNNSWIRNQVLRMGVSENQGLLAGPIMAAAAASTPKKSGKIPAGQEPLETLTDIARRFGKEWDISSGLYLEVASRSELFRVTPTVMATSKMGGSDLNLDGLSAVELTERDSWADYATTVAVPFTADDYEYGVAYEVGDTVVATSGIYYECNTAHTSSGANEPPGSKWDQVNPYGSASLVSVPYLSPFSGSAVLARRVETARNVNTYDDATDVAAARLARYDQAQRDITLDTDTFNLNRVAGGGVGKVMAGDNIYAFSREHDLYDTSAQVLWRGRVVPAATVRVHAVRTKVDPSMSVVVYSSDGSSFAPVDISRWVAFEKPGATLELGEPRRRRGAGGGPTALVSPGFGGI